jgi:hypothetical protein
MEPRQEELKKEPEPRKEERKRRFQIVKLEERLAPRNRLNGNGSDFCTGNRNCYGH